MGEKALPLTTYSEIMERTPEQVAAVRNLEAEGLIAVTEPERIFDGAMLLEGPDDHYYVWPDGQITTQKC